jgi:hypothetical protein
MYQSNLYTMGKDRNGKYHPPKGKPSGAGKNEEGLGVQATPPEKLEQYEVISDRYTIDDDTLAPDVPVRHPNRNTQKGQSRFKNQQDAQDSVKGTAEKTTEEAAATVEAEELPGILSRDVFTELATYKNEAGCISLYLPTNKAGVEVNEQSDAIRFKNSLQQVASRLQVKGWDQGRIKKLLEPGFKLVQQEMFWTKLTAGLAVFIAEGYFKFIKMPMPPGEDLVIESSFYVTPLVPILTSNEEFYVVVISKKQVKLFRGDAFGMEFINVPGLENGLGEAPIIDGGSETTFRLSEGGHGAAAYHGHAGGNNVDDKAIIATYLEAADDVLWKEVLHDKTAPLLIAGVEYMIPIYKSVADYKYLWDDVLTGSYEYTDTPTLYAQAREKMQPLFEQKQQKALALYGNQSATALTSSIVDDVVPAAYYGRIAHLFVERGAHIWGTFDEMANELQVHESEQEGSEHLIDNVVVRTLQTGGEVYVLDKAYMPAEAPLAAIMRY